MKTSIVSCLLAAILAATLVAPSTASAADVTGADVQLPAGISVSGTVSDTHGGPVAGAVAGLCVAPDECFEASTQTAADGSFTVRGITAGTYYLAAMPPDRANLRTAFHTGTPGGSPDPSDAVAVDVPGDLAGIDLHLPDGLRITGRVTNPEGDPVAGVVVLGGAGSSVPSDATGAFEVVGLVSGSFQLQVMPDDARYPNGWVAAGTVEADDANATSFTVVDADVTGADFVLYRGRTISGHVTGAVGAPIAVTAIDAPISYPARVDASGNFKVTGLYPGSYHLLFAVPETLADDESQFPYGIYNGPGKVLADQNAAGVAVSVIGGNVIGLTAVVPALPSLQGTVSDVHGPIAGAFVNACDPDRGCVRVKTGPTGRFSAVNVPSGSYKVTAGAAHHVGVAWEAGRSNPDMAGGVPVTVARTSVTGINPVLPLGNSISGTVTGPGGVPVAGVGVFGAPSSGGISESGPGGVESAADGTFRIPGLVDGDYRLSLQPPENSDLLRGYWSEGGWTADSKAATVIHLVDTTAPLTTGPVPGFVVGRQLGATTVPVRLRWSPRDPGSGIHHSTLRQQVNGGGWSTVGSPVLPFADRTLAASSAYRFSDRATDYANNTSGDTLGPAFKVLRVQQSSSSVTWKGAWTTARTSSASGGSYRYAKASGASATFRFTGRAVGWVARKGTGDGKAKVYIDGRYIATVDLHASSTWRRIVFAASWTASGAHTLRIVCLATSGHPRVNVDAFVVLR